MAVGMESPPGVPARQLSAFSALSRATSSEGTPAGTPGEFAVLSLVHSGADKTLLNAIVKCREVHPNNEVPARKIRVPLEDSAVASGLDGAAYTDFVIEKIDEFTEPREKVLGIIIEANLGKVGSNISDKEHFTKVVAHVHERFPACFITFITGDNELVRELRGMPLPGVTIQLKGIIEEKLLKEVQDQITKRVTFLSRQHISNSSASVSLHDPERSPFAVVPAHSAILSPAPIMLRGRQRSDALDVKPMSPEESVDDRVEVFQNLAADAVTASASGPVHRPVAGRPQTPATGLRPILPRATRREAFPATIAASRPETPATPAAPVGVAAPVIEAPVPVAAAAGGEVLVARQPAPPCWRKWLCGAKVAVAPVAPELN